MCWRDFFRQNTATRRPYFSRWVRLVEAHQPLGLFASWLEVMRPLVCPLWSKSWIISPVAQPFPASAFTLTSSGGWKGESEKLSPCLGNAWPLSVHGATHTDLRLAAVQMNKQKRFALSDKKKIQTNSCHFFFGMLKFCSLFRARSSFKHFHSALLCAGCFSLVKLRVNKWSTFSAQTHVLGCRSLFQCVFCLTAGVSTSSAWIEEGQPGGVCPMVIQEPKPGPPQWWGDWEGGDRTEKPPPLSDTTLLVTGSLKFFPAKAELNQRLITRAIKCLWCRQSERQPM